MNCTLDFRFHRNMLPDIKDLLSGLIGKSLNFRIVKLTGSRNLKSRMEAIHSQTPLAVVRYSVPIPGNNPLLRYIVANDPGTVAEIEGRSLSEEGIKVILYATKSIDQKRADVISKEDNIYESYINEKSLVEGKRLGDDAGIPRIAFFLSLEGDRLYDTTFVPAAEADEYISIMMNSLMIDHGSHPLLDYYSRLDEEVWRWI